MNGISKFPQNNARHWVDEPHFARLGIRKRLLLGYTTIIIILIVAAIITFFIIAHTKNSVNKFITSDLPTYNNMISLENNLWESSSMNRSWILFHDPKFKSGRVAASVAIDHLRLILDNLSAYWSRNFVSGWQNIKPLLLAFKIAQEKVENASTPAAATEILGAETLPLFNKIMNIIEGPANNPSGGLLDIQYQKLQQGSVTIANSMTVLELLEILILVIVILASIAIALVTATKIVPPLQNAINIAQRIAAGERNLEITTISNDETGDLLHSLGVMQVAIRENEDEIKRNEERMKTVNVRIVETSNSMIETLKEVRSSANEQSTGITEQASSINEITASLEQIDKSSKQTSEKAQTLGEMARQTREKAKLGMESVEQSIQGMRELRDKVQIIAQTILDLSNQTQQVGEITAVVNALAQQSKMLALNASIEAAKAGEAGRGFAVVAIEVKNLAEQSEQSTTQVQKILEDIRHAAEEAVLVTEEGTKGVDNGSKLIEKAGEVIKSLSEMTHEASIASQHIEAAIRQEAIGIEQITVGMSEINQVTAAFVNSVKQTSTAINQLAEIAEGLRGHA